MPVAAQVIRMAEGPEEAKQRILDKVGPYLGRSGLKPVGNNVLVAVYDRAGQKTAGGLYMPDNVREDEFQGKVCLVLAMGNMCCEEHSPGYDAWFGDSKPQVHSWIGASIRDCQQMTLGDVACRMVPWGSISFVCDVPDLAH